jgi:LEA14-like dessication related protein
VGTPENIEIEELSMKAVKLKIMVPIENPNNFSFKIKKANLDLIVNERNVGGVKKMDKLKIPANSNQSYPVSFELSTSDAFTNILFLMSELKTRNPELEVKGSITVSAFGIPKRIKVEHEQKF